MKINPSAVVSDQAKGLLVLFVAVGALYVGYRIYLGAKGVKDSVDLADTRVRHVLHTIFTPEDWFTPAPDASAYARGEIATGDSPPFDLPGVYYHESTPLITGDYVAP